MNIMLFSRILAKTGVGNHIKQLAVELSRQGHRVIVVSGTKNIELDENVTFVQLDTLSSNPLRILKAVKALRGIIREYGIDVVHCHHRKAALLMQIYKRTHRRADRVPVIYTLHAAKIPSDFLHRKLTFVGDKAIAISGEVKKFLLEKLNIPERKIATVYNGVQKIEKTMSSELQLATKEKWGIPRDTYVFAMHSRIDRVKNHLLVVEAVKRLPEAARQKITVLCSGEKTGDYYLEVQHKIREYGLEKNFCFVGWASTEEVFSIADFLLLPSTNEGFALSVAEAFMMRVPVARTRTAGFDEQKYCFPISACDPQDVVDILEGVARGDVEKYRKNIDAAYELAMSVFTVEHMAMQNVKIYKEVCEKQ